MRLTPEETRRRREVSDSLDALQVLHTDFASKMLLHKIADYIAGLEREQVLAQSRDNVRFHQNEMLDKMLDRFREDPAALIEKGVVAERLNWIRKQREPSEADEILEKFKSLTPGQQEWILREMPKPEKP